MKLIGNLRSSICCFSKTSTATSSGHKTVNSTSSTIKNRLSTSLADLFVCQEPPFPSPADQDQQEDSLIDAAAALPNRPSSSSLTSRSTVVGTIFGRRRGHVSFCIQSNASSPPPFLFEISMPTHLLAKEMQSSLLRIVLDCHRTPPTEYSSPTSRRQRHCSSSWTAYCNGRKVGYAVRRRPTDTDCTILHALRSTTAGAGVLFSKEEEEEEGEMLYMRATYERIVGSKDSVSYHLINPGGGSPSQELSVFLLRSG